MFGLGPTELIIILFIVLILFGGKRLPEMAKGLGRGIVDFRTAMREGSTKDDTESESEEKSESQKNT